MTPALLATLVLGGGTVAVRANHPMQVPPMSLEVASPQSEAFAMGKLAGHPLNASNGEQLSTISDFLIEPQSGRVHFAVAGSGAGPGGETYRIIPMSVLASSPGGETFTVRMDRNQWDAVGTLVESRLQGRVSINDDHQQRLHRQFALPGQPAPAVELIRASQLRGREVRAGNEQVGRVEDVVIDLHNHRAAPMVTLASNFAGGSQKFLLPFAQLQLGDQPGAAITTSLTRADFHRLQPGLSPTGQTSAMFGQAPSIGHAANAVQQALSRDQSFATSGVQVIPESRLVLRGAVENHQKKADIERAAQQAAPGVRIDSEITIRNW